MKKSQRYPKKAYIQIFFYFLFLLVPILLIGLGMSFYSIQTKKEDFSNLINRNLKVSAEKIEQHIYTSKLMGINFLQDQTVHNLIIPFYYISGEKQNELVQIPKALMRNQNIMIDYADSIFVYSDTEYVYTASGLNNFDAFFNKYYRYEQYNSQFWVNQLASVNTFAILPITNVTGTYSHANKEIMPIILTQIINNKKTVMVINLSIKKLGTIIKQGSIYNSTEFVVLDEDQDVVMQQSGIPAEKIDNIKRLDSNWAKKKYASIEYEGIQYICTYVHSPELGWRYYSLTPISQFNKEAEKIMLITITLSIGLILIGFVLSLTFSKKIYSPIKKIREMIEQNKDVSNVQVCRSEYDLINNRIYGLIQNTSDYASQLEEVSAQYYSTLILQLLCGVNVKSEIINELLVKEIWENARHFVCTNIYFHFNERATTELKDFGPTTFGNDLKELLPYFFQGSLPVFTVQMSQNMVSCIAGISKLSEKSFIIAAFNKFAKCIEYDLKYINIYIGIGNAYNSLQRISKSYNEAMSAIHYHDIDKPLSIIDASNINIEHKMCFDMEDRTKIMNGLKSKDIHALEKVVKGIVEKNLKRNVSYQSINLLYSNLYNIGIQFMTVNNIAIEESFFDQVTLKNNEQDYQRMNEKLMLFYEGIIGLFLNEKSNKTDMRIAKVIQYIEDHYQDELCLEKIAEDTNTSVKYLSRIFKQKVGANISDHISAIRIDKAKELLVGTDLKIEDIANEVGIFSRTTFLRLFKKHEGINPSQYRETAGVEEQIQV